MKSVSGRDFARIIERRGWTLLRVSGSHHIYGKSGSVVRLSIPIHGNKPLKTCCGIWRNSPNSQTTIFST
jgi:predicted RNA binding protein YcfA (HicA-like mRNA interferase family)